MMKLVTAVLMTLRLVHGQAEANWTYGNGGNGGLNPKHWYLSYEVCQGKRQSPINIVCDDIFPDNSLKPIRFENYDKPISGSVYDDGHTIKVDIPKSAGIRLVSESFTAPYYRLAQFHFHWGTSLRHGSEHAIMNRRWPIEMHLVHVDDSIPANETFVDKGSMMVVSVLFDTDDRPRYTGHSKHPGHPNKNQEHPEKQEHGKHPKIQDHQRRRRHDNNKRKRQRTKDDALEDLSVAIGKLVNKEENSRVELDDLVIGDLLPEGHSENFLRYSGSLTTPPCAEVVEWVIMTRTKDITKTQLQRFRSTEYRVESVDDKGNKATKEVHISENDRPLQALNDRPVRLRGDWSSDLPRCKSFGD